MAEAFDDVDRRAERPGADRGKAHRAGALIEAHGIEAEGDDNSTVQATGIFAKRRTELCRNRGLPPGVSNIEDVLTLDRELQADFERCSIAIRPLSR